MTDRAWFNWLLWHPAKKRSGSILSTPKPARGDSNGSLPTSAIDCQATSISSRYSLYTEI